MWGGGLSRLCRAGACPPPDSISAELGQERLRGPKVRGVEALGEPPVDRGEDVARLVASAPCGEQARQAHRRTQLERLLRSGASQLDRAAEALLGRVRVRLGAPQEQ